MLQWMAFSIPAYVVDQSAFDLEDADFPAQHPV